MDSKLMNDAPLVWHSLTGNAVLEKLKSSEIDGLPLKEVAKRQQEFGLNELSHKKPTPFWVFFLHQFKSPLIYLLLVAAGIAYMVGEATDALVILVVLLLNALIGSFHENRAQISMEALKSLTCVQVRVLRDQSEVMLDAKELVPGDIMLLNEGDSIAADARLLYVHSLEVSEASLTGESMPIAKLVKPLPEETTLADRLNMVYGGTHISKGKGKAIVVSTGMSTEIGQIAYLTRSTQHLITPLREKIALFSRYILFAAMIVFSLVVGIGLLQGLPFTTIFMIGLSQVVSMVPEGLPVAITVALAVGMQKMASRKALVRKLDAVETLGSTNIICTDKTGTLTRNEMTVTEILIGADQKIEVTGSGYSPIGELLLNRQKILPAQSEILLELLRGAALCNDAKLSKKIGDPTEISLLNLVQKAGEDPEEIRKRYTRIQEIPFDAEIKMMAVLVKDPQQKEKIFIKGAPEEVLKLCSMIWDKENETPLIRELLQHLSEEETAMASRALRLIAFAVIDQPAAGSFDGGWKAFKGQAHFLGITGQFDPPRMEVKAAVHACHSAGIKTVIVTGDHKITGLAIAKMLNIATDEDSAIDGQELSSLSDEEFTARIPHISVYARVHPSQKLRIVKAWQLQNATVAMTGDGVNDAPALAKADVGVAMGITGTEVAKEAAKIVITDDNFATIVEAVREGRIVYRNIKKLLLYLISTGLSELIVLFTALIFGLPLPLAAVQILWINLVTDGALALPLILEPSEGDEMEQAPIPRNEALITGQIVSRMVFMIPAMAASTLFYFIFRLSSDFSFAQVQTGTFTVLAVSQWFNALNCRSGRRSALKGLLKNRWLLCGLLIGNFLHMAVVFLPPLNRIFHTAALPLSEVFLIGSLASVVLWVEELRKLWVRYASEPSNKTKSLQ